jgi:hypothetical protein
MKHMNRLGSIVMVVSALAGCTERVNVCHSDSDCTNPAFPFCDVNGEYDESGHVANSCSIEPANCPVERCGCTPGQSTCSGETLTTCNSDGHDVTTETCSLGCASGGTKCQIFDPSNGLTNLLLSSVNSPDVTLPDGTTIDTTTGVVKVDGQPITVESVTSAPTSGPSIRVLLARSWTIGDVRVTGTLPLALLSVGPIRVDGVLDASARLSSGGPGAQEQGACVGQSSVFGGGGGGNATAGGKSAAGSPVTNPPPPAAGGSAIPLYEPFTGGCSGGAARDSEGQIGPGGAGGGAIQLASLTEVTVTATISLGGGGAPTSPGGGGSGGNLLVEAPQVHISGGLFLNGGSGAACAMSGSDANQSTEPATGPSCNTGGPASTRAGTGGAGMTAPTAGSNPGTGAPAGGGGAGGRVRISTRNGAADITDATVSARLDQVTLHLP